MPYAYGATITHEFDGTKLNIWLTFRHPMNQDNKPALAKWTLTVDTVDKAISDSAWIDEYTLWLESVATVTYPTRVLLAYTGTDENLETTWGKNWEPWGDSLSTDIGRIPSYIDRGDPAAYDWTKTDFTQDGAWYDLDCSGIVPEGAQVIHFATRIRHANVGEYFSLRENGNANAVNISQLRTQIAMGRIEVEFLVKCDSNRIVEYRATAPAWSILDLAVRGWIF